MVMQKASRRFLESSFFHMCWVYMSAVTSCRGLAVSVMSSKSNLSRGQSVLVSVSEYGLLYEINMPLHYIVGMNINVCFQENSLET
jgi:hypothetical protein